MLVFLFYLFYGNLSFTPPPFWNIIISNPFLTNRLKNICWFKSLYWYFFMHFWARYKLVYPYFIPFTRFEFLLLFPLIPPLIINFANSSLILLKIVADLVSYVSKLETSEHNLTSPLPPPSPLDYETLSNTFLMTVKAFAVFFSYFWARNKMVYPYFYQFYEIWISPLDFLL